jgi:hypothetical protein
LFGYKSVFCKFKNIVAVDLNRQLEVRKLLEAAIKKITVLVLTTYHGENAEKEPPEDASKYGYKNKEKSKAAEGNGVRER